MFYSKGPVHLCGRGFFCAFARSKIWGFFGFLSPERGLHEPTALWANLFTFVERDFVLCLEKKGEPAIAGRPSISPKGDALNQ